VYIEVHLKRLSGVDVEEGREVVLYVLFSFVFVCIL